MSLKYYPKTLPNSDKRISSSFVGYNRNYTNSVPKWTRPNDWLPMPTIDSAEQKIACLVYISNNNSNFLAFTVQGNYTVDWGDGTVENFSSGTSSYHLYSYSSYDASNTTLTSDGFKQTIAIITPQGGSNITLLNLQTRHTSAASANSYAQPIWEIYISAPNLTSLSISGSNSSVTPRNIRYINFINTGAITSFSSLCSNSYSLCAVAFGVTASITTTSSMFNGCFSLTNVSVFNTAFCTSMSSMFSGCSSLPTVPLFDTRSCSDMSSMFYGCRSLTSVPLFNMSACTTTYTMFYNCSLLKSVPLFNTSRCTNLSYMFYTCPSLISVPLFNTSACTNMSGMFNGCVSLISVPLFNTSACTTTYTMFSGCSSLVTVPLFNTANCTNMSFMFYTCYSLVSVPNFNTSACTNASYMFNGCSSLSTVPALNLSNSAGSSNIFDSDLNLASILMTGYRSTLNLTNLKLSKESLETVFTNLGIGTGLTITITNNFGAPTPTSLSATTVAGSITIVMANTTGLTVGMLMTGTGTPLTTGISVTFADVGDLVNLASHGLSDNDVVSFSSITSTTGIVINTIYYVVNSSSNSFQLSDSLGGAAKSLTTNGSGTLKYNSTISSITPNTSIIMTRPMVSSGTNTLAFRSLQTSPAILKGWTVTT